MRADPSLLVYQNPISLDVGVVRPIKEENSYKFHIPLISIILDFISILITVFVLNRSGSYKSLTATIICIIGLFCLNLVGSYRSAYLLHKELGMKVKREYIQQNLELRISLALFYIITMAMYFNVKPLSYIFPKRANVLYRI